MPEAICSVIVARSRSGREDGYRVVLGSVSVPPALLPQSVSTPSERWPFWQKAGFHIRSGSPTVTVTVPKAWRGRVAIDWGGTGPASQLRFEACDPAAGLWDHWAGGFHLRSASACVPLVVRVGRRTSTVHFGLGRRCAAR